MVSIFVDANAAAASHGEKGAEIATGPRVGPETLERVLCEGRVQVIALDRQKPVALTLAARPIPAATRRFVLWRDSGCVVDGCSSRYRLEPHHIKAFAQGGDHDRQNLATLCWFHHHVVVHGSGYRLDPDSPPQRRKLLRPAKGPDPPANWA